MGKGGPGHWGNPGHPPLPADGHPGKLFLLLPSARPEKKKDLFSIREVARMRNITTWAPQLSMDKQTELPFLQNHHCQGAGSGVLFWGDEPLAGSQGSVGCCLRLCELLTAAPHWSMDPEGLMHSAINILFTTLSGFSRHTKTVQYFMIGKNQRISKSNVSQTQAFGSYFHICCVCITTTNLLNILL